jgi:hypothetical protein
VARRFTIQILLPFLLCLFPVLLAGIVVLAIPPLAMRFYLEQITHSPMDWLILGSGTVLFLWQITLTWRALQWHEAGFYEQFDRRLSNLAQAGEWFPLLGLIGTVAGILQTFSSITGSGHGPISPQEIIEKYSPAITATGSGLFMALINILPLWVVQFGRELIQRVGGEVGPQSGEMPR